MNIVGLGIGPFAGGVVAQALAHPLLTPCPVFGLAALLSVPGFAPGPLCGDPQSALKHEFWSKAEVRGVNERRFHKH